jgi:Fe-S-cluster containining protein
MKKNTRRTSHSGALDEVRSVYAELAGRPAERNCTLLTECCQFKLTGRTPQLTRGEAVLSAKAFRATGRKQMPEPTDGSCPMLDPKTGKCLIYESRPFGCRTHFCRVAGGPYERRDVLDLIRRLESVDANLGGDGPHPIQSAVQSALKAL